MGMITETNILTQAKKGQGETNKRLEALLDAQQALVEEQRVTNQWLARIAALLEAQQAPVQQRPAAQYQGGAPTHPQQGYPQQQGRR